ncbi:ribonuclease H-like domain-containing protein [Tanacetum coccineum]|uniref:Ribonuclease H-like domain-containing protein n=1 Tax=Tanacetum coccineum TaxID=301880 RepID=A0ABQ5BQK2_9ASTR
MSQPANDEFSQHLSDDEASNHEDASDTGNSDEDYKKGISTGKDGVIRILPPVTAAEIQAVEKERKAKNILLMAIPKEHMRRFHGMDDAKEIWEAIRTRFGGNANLKKMHKALEAHGVEVFNEEANHKVFEQEIQGASINICKCSNVAFVSPQKQSISNKVKSAFTGAYSTCTPSTSSTNISKKEALAGFADEVIYSLFAKQSEDWDLLHEDLEQIDDLDIEEMDINCRTRYRPIRRRVRVDGKAPVGFDKKKLECFNCHNTGHFARECTAKGTHDGKKKRDSFYQHQEAGKQEKNQMGLLTMDDGKSNIYEKMKSLKDIGESGMKSCKRKGSVAENIRFMERFFQDSLEIELILACIQVVKLALGRDSVGEKPWTPKSLKPSLSDDRSSEYSTCQSNDSEGFGTSSEHSVDPESEISRVPQEVYVSKPITTNEKGVSALKSKEVEPSCVSHIKTPRQQIKDQETPKVNRKNWNAMMERETRDGYSFTKKKCFVCGSLSHLIKNYDYYEKKMAREAAPKKKKQRVFNTGNRVAKPVWTNDDRINHANQFVPRPVQLNAGRTNINSVRPNINTGRTNINSVRPRVNTVNSNVNTVRSRQPVPTRTSNSFSPKRPQGKGGTAVKTSAGYNCPNSNCDSGPTFIRTVITKGPQGRPKPVQAWLLCYDVTPLDPSADQAELRVLHFNLFSISQICDKQHKVLFTETECLVVSSDFKMPDEKQILLKVPRHHNIYSFDMKTPTPAKGFACLIAKATSDESKLWHRRTLIEAARTMLADSLLPTTFWAEAVSTACYIFNRVRVTKPQNKTPYELLFGHKPIISYIRPFGCHVTILDTLSVLGKFDGKSNEGFLVGYSLNSKAYRVYNLVTKRVEVNLHVNFLEDKPNVKGVGYRWMFDIDYLTDSMNYIPVSLENQANPHAGTSEVTNSAGTSQTPNAIASEEKDEDVELIVVPSAVKNTEEKVESRKSSTNSKTKEILTEPPQEKEASSTDTSEDNPKILAFRRELEEIALKHLGTVSGNNSTSTPSVNTGSESVNTGRLDPDDSSMPELEIFHKSSYDEEGVITDFNSLPTEIEVSPTPTLRIHNIHSKSQILGDPKSLWQTRSKVHKNQSSCTFQLYSKAAKKQSQRSTHCLICLFTILREPKKISKGSTKDNEEVYVSQPPGFVDPAHPKEVTLRAKPHFVLMDPRNHLDLEAFSDSDYGGSNLEKQNPNRNSMDLQNVAQRQKQNKVFDVSSFSANDFGNSNGKQTPLSGCQEHPDVAPSQPSSSTITVPSTSLPLVQSPPPITTHIPASTPTPIPETDPAPMEHTFKEPSHAHQHFSPP